MAEKRHLVVTVFENQPAATAAAEWLKKWESDEHRMSTTSSSAPWPS